MNKTLSQFSCVWSKQRNLFYPITNVMYIFSGTVKLAFVEFCFVCIVICDQLFICYNCSCQGRLSRVKRQVSGSNYYNVQVALVLVLLD